MLVLEVFSVLFLIGCSSASESYEYAAPKLDIDNLDNGYHGIVKENETIVEVTPVIRAIGQEVCRFRIVNKHHGEAPFEIILKDEGYAELRAKRVLNCEKRKNYKFDIASVGCNGKQSVSATVHITVSDVNEYAPTFSEPSYVRQVDEGRIYNEIVRVEATDRDCTPKFGDVCKYEILTSDQPFVIDMDGVIRNTEPLDYERSHNHILSVIAYDCGMRQSFPALVTIKVNRVCRLGWRGLPERVDYAPMTGKQELFPSAGLELCDVPCNVRELRTRVDLATRSTMNNGSLSKQSLDKLRCGLCTRYLSVGPINFSKDKFTCGRCRNLGIRIAIYEELAKRTIFPCVYQNCTEKLAWGQVRQHEEQCRHRTIRCPAYNCQKSYELHTIHLHFAMWHKRSVLAHPAKAKRSLTGSTTLFTCDNKVFFTEFQDAQFLIFVHSDISPSAEATPPHIASYHYSFGVFSINKPAVNFKYSVIIEAPPFLTKVRREQNVENFNNKVHCLNCLKGACTLKLHKKSSNFLPCKIQLVNFGNMDLTYTVKVSNRNEEKVTVTEPPPSECTDIATNLECPICEEYMSAPIYNCATGHSFCNHCKKKITLCPYCMAELGDSRNFLLENISESVKIPCQNANKGCPFLGSIKSTRDHEKQCL